MCLIITSSNGYIPRNHLHQALVNNPDGWGIAVTTGQSIWLRRGLHSSGFWPTWNQKPRGDVIFHARIRTHGDISIDNCQPLLITSNLALAHNGIIDGDRSNTLSDTRIFIRDILTKPVYSNLLHPSIQRLILQYIGSSKLVFFNHRGIVWIANQESGKMKKDRWYSNQSYKPPHPLKPASTFTPLNNDRRIPEYYQRLINKHK